MFTDTIMYVEVLQRNCDPWLQSHGELSELCYGTDDEDL